MYLQVGVGKESRIIAGTTLSISAVTIHGIVDDGLDEFSEEIPRGLGLVEV